MFWAAHIHDCPSITECAEREECCQWSREYQDRLMEQNSEIHRYSQQSVNQVCLDEYADWQSWMDELYDEKWEAKDLLRICQTQNKRWEAEITPLRKENHELHEKTKYWHPAHVNIHPPFTEEEIRAAKCDDMAGYTQRVASLEADIREYARSSPDLVCLEDFADMSHLLDIEIGRARNNADKYWRCQNKLDVCELQWGLRIKNGR